MDCHVKLQWTQSAKDALAKLPKKVRHGLLEQADEIAASRHDPRTRFKPLQGPLRGLYRIVYSRYRAIFKVEERKTESGSVVLQLTVIFVAAGVRKEFDKHDVYEVAKKLLRELDAGVLGVDRDDAPEVAKKRPPRKRKK